MDPAWAIDIRDQCVNSKVAFFFKQWGGRTPKTRRRLLEGREWNQFPKQPYYMPPQPELRTVA